MTVEITSETTAESLGQEYIARAKSIAPLIVSESEAIERERKVTRPVVDALKSTELFWMLVPSALGGGGIGVSHAVEVLEEISRADGSTGWAFMANSFGNAIAAGYLPAEGVEELFGGDEKAITCGFSGPVGTAVEVEGGIIATAPRLSFGSGSDHATHIGSGLRIVLADGSNKILENGQIDARFAYARREDLKFHGNWDVMGMVGTGSVDYELPEQFIPNKFVLSTFSTTPNRSEGVYSFGLLGISVAGHAGVALGIMKRALQEIARIALTKSRSGQGGTVAENPLFRHAFAIKEAEFQAARAYTLNALKEAADAFERDGELTPEHSARIQQVSTWVHNVADDVVNFCQLWGGSRAFRNPSALGRCTRDIAVAKGHLLIDQNTLIDTAPPLIERWAGDLDENS
ncbi:acyl-CoA dehydrogenase family protein [Arthrobacter mobilis]|uniref:Oxidoreductase n=1 Tax=Arthrobacter mobilis TaxID=2724944 RepID=A0A7X6HH36_9MICC|nr:acyl-CoA dehydrogenase family protein [Arthrobacter mobilis]NKX55911.1 oxidoreductase [Arthrobacter mobilis]